MPARRSPLRAGLNRPGSVSSIQGIGGGTGGGPAPRRRSRPGSVGSISGLGAAARGAALARSHDLKTAKPRPSLSRVRQGLGAAQRGRARPAVASKSAAGRPARMRNLRRQAGKTGGRAARMRALRQRAGK
jgi:hypothetical protein